MSQRMAKPNTTNPAPNRSQRSTFSIPPRPNIGSIAAAISATAVTAKAAVPAATVIGTMNRRQWSSAAPAASKPMPAPIRALA